MTIIKIQELIPVKMVSIDSNWYFLLHKYLIHHSTFLYTTLVLKSILVLSLFSQSGSPTPSLCFPRCQVSPHTATLSHCHTARCLHTHTECPVDCPLSSLLSFLTPRAVSGCLCPQSGLFMNLFRFKIIFWSTFVLWTLRETFDSWDKQTLTAAPHSAVTQHKGVTMDSIRVSNKSHQWLCVPRVLNVLGIEGTKLELLLLHFLLLRGPLSVRPWLQYFSLPQPRNFPQYFIPIWWKKISSPWSIVDQGIF